VYDDLDGFFSFQNVHIGYVRTHQLSQMCPSRLLGTASLMRLTLLPGYKFPLSMHCVELITDVPCINIIS
jgi:hypothetical protein